jgi:nucleotide-binding universal stress UspA family protein
MKQIIVGIEPQPAGQRALEWALREAVVRRVPLTAVRAWRTPPGIDLYYPVGSDLAADVPAAEDEAQQIAEQMLKEARERVAGADAVDARADAVMGAPGEVLVDVAGDASLIVVGTRGAGALSRAVLGSVSAAVLHHARCPVAVVPEHAVTTSPVTRVLVGVDHSPESRDAMRVAVEEARAHVSRLVPLLVRNRLLGLGDDLDDDLDFSHLEASERTALREAAVAAGAKGIPLEPEVLTGQPAAELRHAAQPGDVLVLGSHGRGGFAGLLLGSTSSQVAQHAPCPVLVVRSI